MAKIGLEKRVVLFLQIHRPFRLVGRVVSRIFLRVLRQTPCLKIPLQNIRALDSQLRAAVRERGLLQAGA